MKKVLKVISTFTCIIMIGCILFYSSLTHSILFMSFSGLLILIINPIINLYRIDRKEIINPIYHLILIGISIYTIIIYIRSIFMYYTNYQVDFGNQSQLYSTENFPIILLMFTVVFISSLIFKKVKTQRKRDISKIIFFIISIISFMPAFSDSLNLQTVISLSIGLFSLIMIFKFNSLHTAAELRKLYIPLIILCILSMNIVSAILVINMFIDLDKFGLNL